MAHYDDVILPLGMSRGSAIGPTTSTQQLLTTGGYRKTNKRWDQKLRRFDIGFNVKTISDLHTVQKIYEVVDGPFGSFLARDWGDWNTTDGNFKAGDESLVTKDDQPLQNTVTSGFQGDASTTTFQMVKNYTVGATAQHIRTIKKPANGTILVAINGVLQTEGVDYTVNYSTGLVTFTSPPGSGLDVTWGGEFYIAVGFVDDELLFELDFENNEASIVLQEVRL